MMPEFVTGVEIVTVTPAGIILSSAAKGTVPVLHVVPVFQSPLLTAVTTAASASCEENTVNKISNVNEENTIDLVLSTMPAPP
jgi:hypothetical protein